MTRHTVVWLVEAQAALGRLWFAAADRDAITAASHGIDRILRQNPEIKGFPLSEGLRALVVAPLQATFHVRDEDRIAEVSSIRLAFADDVGRQDWPDDRPS